MKLEKFTHLLNSIVFEKFVINIYLITSNILYIAYVRSGEDIKKNRIKIALFTFLILF